MYMSIMSIDIHLNVIIIFLFSEEADYLLDLKVNNSLTRTVGIAHMKACNYT